MSLKNKGFSAGLAAMLGEPGEADATPKARSQTGMLAGRTNRLAELASGHVVTRTHEFVLPEKCRLWPEHNRDFGSLTIENCHDLVDSIRAQGKQEVPAIVRRIRDDPNHDYEVIAGARRFWAINWLRQNNYTEFRFLIEVRDLTDEEAFRVSDLENRARRDLSDYERAHDYLKGLNRYYSGHQKTMAERLHVSESWISRYLDLARLPSDIVAAFASPHDLRIKHVTQIKPLLKDAGSRERMLDRARDLARRRKERSDDVVNIPADVVRQLMSASAEHGRKQASAVPLASLFVGRGCEITAKSRSKLTVSFDLTILKTRADARARLDDLIDAAWPREEPHS